MYVNRTSNFPLHLTIDFSIYELVQQEDFASRALVK